MRAPWSRNIGNCGESGVLGKSDYLLKGSMFKWFKKSAADVEVAPESAVVANQGEGSITQHAINESVALKDQGNAHFENGKLDEAAECYRRAIACNPRYAEACTNLGFVFQVQGNLNEAVAYYRKALGFDPNLLMAQQNLGFALIGLGQIDAAEESLRRVIALAPEHAGALYSLGVIAAQRGDFPHAETQLRRALELQPDYLEAHYNLGNLLRQTRRLPEAEASYRRALELKPDFAEAHSNLSDVLQELGRMGEAEASLRRTLQLRPDYADKHCSLGNVLHALGRTGEAEASYRRALELKPDYAEAHSNLGVVLNDLGRLDEAETSLRRALQLKPDYAEAHYNLANTLKALGRFDAAETSYRRALQLKPDFADAHGNLGNILMALGRLGEAEASYRQALQIRPNYAESHYNLGVILNDLGRLDEAEASYRRALEINPDYAAAHSNLGGVLDDLGRLDEAEASYRRALQIKPDYVYAHYNLGITLQNRDRLDEADASYRRALQIKPDYAEPYNNLGSTLQKRGQLADAAACFRRALEIKPDYDVTHSNLIFTLDMMTGEDPASLHEERKRWNAAHAARLHQQRTYSNVPDSERRLRIAYVSADFRVHHSASRVFGGMLTQYDRSQFDVFAYSNSKKKDDKFTGLFRQGVTVWRDIVGLPDEAVAEMIREDRIDILVDLSGHSEGNRLLVFARKPAPIQITAWGYATGTGMAAMDVFFTDPVMVPPQEKQYFSEEVRYLPSVVGAFFNEPFPDVNGLPALSDGIITFGSLNRLTKISAEAYRVWAEVLLAVPRSRLLLKTPELNDAAIRERVVGHFTQAGVAAERIIMQGKSSWHEHMQAYNQIDLALDPFPHGGGVTALEGLIMGVPMITLRWPTMVGRLSASIMTTLALTDWIAETEEAYVKLAMQKASDLQSLAALRQQLRSVFNSSVIGDQVAYARAVEQEYRQLWREWCSSIEK